MKKAGMVFLLWILLVPSHGSASDLDALRFSLINGDVQLKTEDTDDWVPVSMNMPLQEGDRIWVPDEARAELQSKDGDWLRLAGTSALEILRLDNELIRVDLAEGRLYSNFRGRKDSLLQVDTPTSCIRVRGKSKFNVDVDRDGLVNVSVFQGEISVEDREGEFEVKGGEALLLGEGGVSEKSTLGSPDEWESWNRDRDRETAERRPSDPHLPDELQAYSNDFYGYGRWVYTPEYGYVWTPRVSVPSEWAPYRSGRWVWIRGDYVWVPYEPWGWVPHHYGRWFFSGTIGWCWAPPPRGAVYWGPGYVGWVYTSRRVAWVPLAPREVYYGRGLYGPHSVNITNVNKTHVHVDKVVYKNVKVHNAVTVVNHDTFVRGRPAEGRIKENPFLTEKIHFGGPPIQPVRASRMPIVREVPESKRPPEVVRAGKGRELKTARPMVKSKGVSVSGPGTRGGEVAGKTGVIKTVGSTFENDKQEGHPSRIQGEVLPSAQAAKQPGPTPARQNPVEVPKKAGASEMGQDRSKQLKPRTQGRQGQNSGSPEGRGESLPGLLGTSVPTPKETIVSEQGLKNPGERKTMSPTRQETRKERFSGTRRNQEAPLSSALGVFQRSRPPETSTDGRMKSGTIEKSPSFRAPQRSQGGNDRVSLTERVPREEPKSGISQTRGEQPREARSQGRSGPTTRPSAASKSTGREKRL